MNEHERLDREDPALSRSSAAATALAVFELSQLGGLADRRVLEHSHRLRERRRVRTEALQPPEHGAANRLWTGAVHIRDVCGAGREILGREFSQQLSE